MSALDLATHVHRRLNALTGEWILVSPQRTARPWRGQVEDRATEIVPNYDASCYMCPANLRASGERNPSYQSTFAFTNDFPALTPPSALYGLGVPVASGFSRKSVPPTHPPLSGGDGTNLMVAEAETGTCRVVCFSPRHDLTLSRMTREAIRLVIDLFASERTTLTAREDVRYVQIFENRGAMMGASNPHPHGQIWASASVPPQIVTPALVLGSMGARPVGRLPRPRDDGTDAPRVRQRGIRRAGTVLGDLALRNAHCAPSAPVNDRCADLGRT